MIFKEICGRLKGLLVFLAGDLVTVPEIPTWVTKTLRAYSKEAQQNFRGHQEFRSRPLSQNQLGVCKNNPDKTHSRVSALLSGVENRFLMVARLWFFLTFCCLLFSQRTLGDYRMVACVCVIVTEWVTPFLESMTETRGWNGAGSHEWCTWRQPLPCRPPQCERWIRLLVTSVKLSLSLIWDAGYLHSPVWLRGRKINSNHFSAPPCYIKKCLLILNVGRVVNSDYDGCLMFCNLDQAFKT